MPSTEAERLLNEIGTILIEMSGGPSSRTLLHAQLATNMVGISIFVKRSKHVEYLDSDNGLTDLLLDLWEQDKPRKRWAEITYLLHDGKFSASFTYPDQVGPDEDLEAFSDRRDRIVMDHLGDGPVVYPSILDDGSQRFDM